MSNFFPGRILTTGERLIIPEAFFQLFLERIKVSFFPSRKYLPTSEIDKNIFPSSEKIDSVKIVASVINGLSTRTPWSSTCLIKVLAAHKMLARRRIPHVLHFGVHINQSKEIKAHAWLSVASEAIIGGDNLHFYKEISRINF
jgi:hypothetical protein